MEYHSTIPETDMMEPQSLLRSDSMNSLHLNETFKSLTRKDAEKALQRELQRLLHTAPPPFRKVFEREFEMFQRIFKRFLSAETTIDWEQIKLPSPQEILPYVSLSSEFEHDQKVELLNKVAVVKLNGGLGTSMGCHGPKSLISVRNDLTFLDLHVQQVEKLNKSYGVNIPLVLMDSFNTNEDMQKVLVKYSNVEVDILRFQQTKHPRLNKETLLPIVKSLDLKAGHDGWCPSGHGSVYESLYYSGMLKKLLDAGKKYIFISNIDNLGATVDLSIINLMSNPPSGQSPPEFVMEVTDKTAADVKGGTLVEYENKMRLLELAQVPKEKVDEFKSVNKFKIFNTNNLWVNLNAINRVIEEETLQMEIIVNPKTLDDGTNVIQLEQAAGAAIQSFDNAVGVNVPRKRFLPVKMTSDLLLVMSNLYKLRYGQLTMSDKRVFPVTPLVKLGTHFSKVKDFLTRFSNIPDIMELHHLTVSGDVTFGKDVVLKGTVIIIANHGDRIDIPSGAVLENKIVSGNLRILDH
ncbi:UTP--glucose-1-phosphate uridylyltransferase-like [Watersipora subatra]|uniref:UTP--glucose-1-phosphate uridylyltransferase-like n=1 Tax=Watersipora subatra TaxID=2589382 RepID=UPI00355C387D